MKVHQAIYGEDRSHGHGLLAHSPQKSGERVPFVEATRRTDLPGTPAAGTTWAPYLRGFTEGAYFVLARTFPDEQASRKGMGITHSLFLPLDAFCAIGSLSSAVELLWREPWNGGTVIMNAPLNVLELADRSPLRPDRSSPGDVEPQRYQALVHALVDEGARSPIVWIGQGQFDYALATLWEFLSPQLRRVFTFRISFSPRDVEDSPPLLVCTPELLGSHWPPPFRSVGLRPGPTLMTMPMAYLIGGGGSHAMRDLQESLELAVDSLAALRDLARIHSNLEEFQAKDWIAPLDASLRVIAERVPSPTCGVGAKSKLLLALAERTAVAGRAEVRALRNFPAGAFPNGPSIVAQALYDWVQSVVREPQRLPPSEAASVFVEALRGDSPWAGAIKGGLRDPLQRVDSLAIAGLWQWWAAEPALVPLAAPLIPNTLGSEEALVERRPPELPAAAGGAVADFARDRHWLRLHAAAVTAYLPFRRALELHLQVDTDPRMAQALTALCEHALTEEVLAAALALDDPRLAGIAGRRLAREPALKAGLDITNSRWRDIWLASIDAGSPPFDGTTDPTAIFWALLHYVGTSDKISSALFSAIVNSGHVDLDLYPHPARPRLWTSLPDDVCAKVLSATANGWLGRFIENPRDKTAASEIEEPLRKAVVRETTAHAWWRQTGLSATVVVAFLQCFPDYPNGEERLVEWIERARPPSYLDAAALGTFIRERRWRGAASAVDSHAQIGNDDWDAAAEQCEDILGRGVVRKFLRTFRKYKTITADDWWTAWFTVAADLYPTGVQGQYIWTRAAGNLARIDLNRDGGSQWYQALELLRRGGAGSEITIEGLLHQMRRDWEDNKPLEMLQRAWEKGRVNR